MFLDFDRSREEDLHEWKKKKEERWKVGAEMHVKSTVFSQWRGGSFVSRLTEENGFGKSLAGSGQRGAVRMKAMLLRMSGGSMFPPYIQTFLPNLFAGRSSLNTVTGEQHETSLRFVSSRLLQLSPPVLADLPLGSSSMATASFFSPSAFCIHAFLAFAYFWRNRLLFLWSCLYSWFLSCFSLSLASGLSLFFHPEPPSSCSDGVCYSKNLFSHCL